MTRPEIRVLVEGLQHFDCAALRACLSTKVCGDRWAAAAPGIACHGCAIGRQHDADHASTKWAGRRPSDTKVSACL